MGEQSRRTGYRLGELAGIERWLAVAVLVAFGAAPLAAGLRALSEGWQATGDVAIIALRSRDAWTGHSPTVGQPTTGEEFTGRRSNHPGPIEYWWLGLTTRALGPQAGLVIGIGLINGAALVGTCWLAYRRGGTALLALMAAALAALVHSLGAASLYDPFNSELATYPMVLALLATWCVVVGDLRVTPVLVAAASVAAQVHVAGATFVAPLLVVAVISVLSNARRHRATVRRELPWLAGSLALLVLLWLPPIIQELSGGPSNVAALWATATAPRPRIGLAFTFERLATAIAPVPTFVRATGRFGFLRDEPPIGVVAAALVVGIAGSLALGLRDRRRTSQAARFTGLVLLATAVSAVAAAGQPPLAAFRADGTRWLWVAGLGIWVTAAWSAWQLAPDRTRDRARTPVLVGGVALAGLLLAVAVGTASLSEVRDGATMAATEALATKAADALPTGRYHVRYDGNEALVTIGPGVVYRLEADGYRLVLDDNAFTRGYGPRRTPSAGSLGPVAGELRIASGPGEAEAGETLVASVPIDAGDPSAGTIRMYLAR